MDNYLDTAVRAVETACGVCRKIQSQLVHDDTLIKKDRSPVTIADYASQAMICKILNGHFPHIPIVGEEESSSFEDPKNANMLDKISSFLPDWTKTEIIKSIDLGNGAAQDLFWTLDPIDGTKGFLRNQQYAVALALIENGQIILGVLGCPNLHLNGGADGSIFYASRKAGAFAKAFGNVKNYQLKVSQNSGNDEIRFLESVESAHSDYERQSKVMQNFGDNYKAVQYDSQVKYAVLAQGAADVYLRLPNPATPDYREKIWDHAAGVAIITEAGGTATDMYGRALDFSAGKKLSNNTGVVVSNGRIHDRIINLLSA
ncbi:MAG: 3'(2'),5'-bisphosphate nucleotidase [Calditrichaceae bacterium]|nr:3'(2'),5'-bisphosphate nucleotidase [Calditrichaceae bacterium]MBN2707820.1 3'(2'),5'-bisphosphate nucleotidase [Calditrichaceae bacterium]RQV96255.1 MAG: 3'(2'),5'-bisphosphate nucleotidase [Calditrichota bacterium]